MIVTGFDPGLNKTGYAVIRDEKPIRVLDFGIIATSPTDGLNQRLAKIFREARLLLSEHQPQKVALEEVYFARNPQTTLKIGLVRGILIAAALEKDLEIASFAPAEVKVAVTGKGNASKKQVQYMTSALTGVARTIPEDSADALAVCLCCLNHRPKLKNVRLPARPVSG